MSKFKPIHGRVVIEVEKLEDVIADSGLVVALAGAKSREGTDRVGRVVAVDSDHPKAPIGVSVGDRVFYQTSWQGEGFEYDGRRYHVMEGEDVAAVLDPETQVLPETL